MTRRDFAATVLGGAAAQGFVRADPPAGANLGLVLYSYGRRAASEKETGFADPTRFLAFARERGAIAVQLSLGVRTDAEAGAVRAAAEKFGMHVEGIVAPPKEGRADLDRLAAELATARACGAGVVRVALLAGRRYEVFDKPADYPAYARRAADALRRAEPLAARNRVVLAVENHKDFRADELADLLGKVGSEWVGNCFDTGNNLALLDDPTTAVAALAPFARTVHLKDIALEDTADGFRMAEVPQGRGCLDLKGTVAGLRKANPRVRFQLEMITRDPLSIPCLGERYWATLGRVPGRDLARTLALARAPGRKEPLPRVSGLGVADQLAAEERNVRESFEYAAKTRLIAG